MADQPVSRDRFARHDWIPRTSIGLHLLVPRDDGTFGEIRKLVPPEDVLDDPAAAGAWLLARVKAAREASPR